MGNCQSEGSSAPKPHHHHHHHHHHDRKPKPKAPIASSVAGSPVHSPKREAKRELDNRQQPGFTIDISVLGRCEDWKKATSVYTTLLKNKLSHDPRIDAIKKEGRIANDQDPYSILEHCHNSTKKESITCHRYIDALSRAISSEMIAEGLWTTLKQKVGNGLMIDLLGLTATEQKQSLLTLPSPRSDFGSRTGSVINLDASVGGRSTVALSDFDNEHGGTEGDNEMFLAASRGDDEAISRLHENGVGVMIKNSWGSTPLHCAATGGHLSSVELLLELGSDIDCVAMGSTPLHLAAINGKAAVCETFVALGASLEAVTSEGHTPLHKAALFANTDIIATLIEAGADVNAASKDGTTPLHIAAKSGNVVAVQLLLSHGADINLQTKTGMTPFHFAARKGSPEVVRQLQQKGADIFKTDNSKSTALHYAARSGHSEVCSLLLRMGLSPNDVDQTGHTPLRHAIKNGDKGVISAIQCLNVDSSSLRRSQSVSFGEQSKVSRKPSQCSLKRASSVNSQYSQASRDGDLTTDALARTYSKRQSRNSMGGFGRRTSSRLLARRGSGGHGAGARASLDSCSNISRDGSVQGFRRRRSSRLMDDY